MIAQPVISVPKDFTPPHAVAPPPPPPPAGGGFAKLLDPDGIVHLTPGSASSGGSSTPPASTDTQKAKSASTDASAASAAVVVPVPIATTPKPIAGQAAGAASSSSAAAATQASSSAAAQQAAAAAAGAGTVTNDPSTQLPPEAAALGARVAAGVPNFLSQPNAALAGLWHHGADGVGDKDAASGGDDKSDASTAGDAGAPAQTAASLKAAAANTLTAQLRENAGDSVAAPAASDSQADATSDATPGDATQSASFALPQGNDIASAPAAAAAPNAPPAPPTHTLPVFEQVAVNLKQAAQNGSERIEIQLKPASLGAINVKLDVSHDGRITAVISADRSDTLHMLRQDAAGLEQSLRDAGLQADSGSLSFNLRGDAQSFAQNQSAPQTGGGGTRDSDSASTAAIGDTQRFSRHDGALDIHV